MTDMGQPTKGRWLALQEQLGKHLSDRLFNEMARQPLGAGQSNSSARSWSLRLALLLAGMTYVAGFGMGVAGLWILAQPWSNLLVVTLGVMLLLMCWVARPRFAPAPDYIVAPADFPELHALGKRIANAMGAPHVDGFGVSADFGANYRLAGWRQRRYVELGSPLLAVLTVPERIAVIAHELSHGANGDPMRGQFLFGAVTTMSYWALAVRPGSIGHSGEGMAYGPIVSLIAIPLELAMLALSELLVLFIRCVLLLVLRQSQRAEYHADRLAATVSGTAEMQAALEKTYLFETVDAALRRHALTTPDDPIGPILAAAVNALPDTYVESQRENSRALRWQVDSAHPPTALRVDMLSRGNVISPMELLSTAELAAVEIEFDRLIALAEREVIGRKLEAIQG